MNQFQRAEGMLTQRAQSANFFGENSGRSVTLTLLGRDGCSSLSSSPGLKASTGPLGEPGMCSFQLWGHTGPCQTHKRDRECDLHRQVEGYISSRQAPQNLLGQVKPECFPWTTRERGGSLLLPQRVMGLQR